jgi:hypothetical protein
MAKRTSHGRERVVLCLAAAAFIVPLLAPRATHATHFRYGHVTWVPKPGSPRTIDFTVQGVWRRDAYGNGSGLNRCVTATNPPVYTNCTGAGGFAGVGDIIHETQGDTKFDFGDGSTLFAVTIGSQTALLYLVTSVDPTNNWLFGLALDHTSLPTINTTIEHTYAAAAGATSTAKIEDCCRISGCVAPYAHLNNPDNGYSVGTTVDLTQSPADSSPVSSVPPIIFCPQNGQCTFQVPVSDNENDPVTYRLASATEMHVDVWESPGTRAGLGEPGQAEASCPDATIDSNTGVYSWNSSGCRLAGSPGPAPPVGGCANSDLASFYSTQVIIEETSGRHATSAVDFLIELVPPCNLNTQSPVFQPPTPQCGSTQSANPGQPLSFDVSATDPDGNDSVTLNAVGVPGSAVLTPTLPTSGNPAGTNFSWTPAVGDVGQHLVTFTATDSCMHQTLCAITLDVSHENCTDGIDNDGDGLIDCADPDCGDGAACDDGNICTANDHCSSGACVGSPTCDDANPCTADSCDSMTGQCSYAPTNEGGACDDANPCTVNDQCNNGTCVGSSKCDDGNPCTADSCDSMTGLCTNDPAPLENAACDDGKFCTDHDHCASGTCIGAAVSCDDTNPCTQDSCNEAEHQCVNDPAPLENSPCSDGRLCTDNDKCVAGVCTGTLRSCPGNNPCAADSCDEATGQCVNHPLAEGDPCDDGHFCTINDVCRSGTCVGTARGCADTNPCTQDSCDLATDKCVNDPAPLEGTACSDGNLCTTGDTCTNGVCTGTAVDCNDGQPCTVDTCDPLTGVCAHSNGPAPGCLSPLRSVLKVRKGPSSARDKVIWRWLKGPTEVADLGDPTGSTEYALCIYDLSNAGATSQLALQASVPPGGPWQKLGGTNSVLFRFTDVDATGKLKVRLKALASGKGKLSFKSKGDRVALPTPVGSSLFADDDAVVVQLVNSAGRCWQSRLPAAAIKNNDKLFKDRCGATGTGACE